MFILLLHFAQVCEQKVLFDTGVGNKRRLIDIKAVIGDVGKDLCSALPGLHAFSGCDTTSAFVRKGKLQSLKILKRHKEFLPSFKMLGSSEVVDEELHSSLEKFTCLLYAGKTNEEINKLRLDRFQQRFSPKQGKLLSSGIGVDLSLLPPCQDALRMHIRRVNYQALIWYQADKPTPVIPHPDQHGWVESDGNLEISWTDGPLLPQELIDVLYEESPEQSDDEDNEEEDEMENLDDVVFE